MEFGTTVLAMFAAIAAVSYVLKARSARSQKRRAEQCSTSADCSAAEHLASIESTAFPPGERGGVLVIREGRAVEPSEAWHAWMSEDMDRMLAALDGPAAPVDRHFLFMRIVQQAYKRREADPEMRALCVRIARKHVEEFDDIIEPLKREFGLLPRVPTFQHLATVLTEAGEFDEAISVCEAALSYSLDDGTKGGFAGRIARIRRKQARENGT